LQALNVLEICLAALGGAVVGALGYRFVARQQIGLLQQRLQRSEEARNGAVERSASAREQIAQLSKAISELRRAHQSRSTARPAVASSPEERRAAAERELARVSDGRHDDPDARAPAFANTEPMQY
jgi:chromosome segregation ATPase